MKSYIQKVQCWDTVLGNQSSGGVVCRRCIPVTDGFEKVAKLNRGSCLLRCVMLEFFYCPSFIFLCACVSRFVCATVLVLVLNSLWNGL